MEKIVVVTGGATGIGLASVERFLSGGNHVALIDLANDIGEDLASRHERLTYFPADVGDPAQVDRAFADILELFGRIDWAHNNAGILGASAPTHECSLENWDQVIDINLRGVWLCMKHELKAMLPTGYGAIVNTSSIWGVSAGRDNPAYVASKHGIVGLSRAAAIETAGKGIRVNAVCPGTIDTPILRHWLNGDEAFESGLLAQKPMHRFGTPAEIAEVAYWLCSDASSFVTAQAIVADGAEIAGSPTATRSDED